MTPNSERGLARGLAIALAKGHSVSECTMGSRTPFRSARWGCALRFGVHDEAANSVSECPLASARASPLASSLVSPNARKQHCSATSWRAPVCMSQGTIVCTSAYRIMCGRCGFPEEWPSNVVRQPFWHNFAAILPQTRFTNQLLADAAFALAC